MRQAINNLQLTFNGYGKITSDLVFKLCDKPHPMIIKNIFIECSKNNPREALKLLELLYNDGFSNSDISISMMNSLKSIKFDMINEELKIKFLTEISKACLIISSGIDSNLQLTGCIAKMSVLN